MPFYDHRCPNGHEFDDLRPASKVKDEIKCPECGEVAPVVPSRVSPPQGCPTPKFYPGRS